VFGRNFDAAQFALQAAAQPPCELFLSREIPGPYPAYSLGWGGANAAGYSSLEYDQACRSALTALPESPQYAAAHQQAQTIFAGDLPALPLYWRYAAAVTRPDFCGLSLREAPQSILGNLEGFQYGEACRTP
jgi:peptide/nickel transport system substrate-binding protein